jgi:hypothetical protein
MNTNRLLKATAAFVGIVVAPVVLGRFGGDIAEFLHAEVLMGFAVAATLVALNILESKTNVRTQAITRVLARRFQRETNTPVTSQIVPLWRDQERKAA